MYAVPAQRRSRRTFNARCGAENVCALPIILIGQVIGAVGTGLLTTLSIATPTRLWATYMTLAGLGIDMVENTPYNAIQAVMER